MERTKIERALPPVHPGAILREDVLPALKAGGTPRTQVAEYLGVSRRTLYDLLDEKGSVTPMLALRLGKLCGNGPDLWLNLQNAFDLAKARAEMGEQLEAIPTLKVA